MAEPQLMETTMPFDADVEMMLGGLQPRATVAQFERSAAWFLSRPQYWPHLAMQVQNDDATSARAARILGQTRDPQYIPVLVVALERDGITASTAAMALAELGTPDAVLALIKATQHPQRQTATFAIEAIRHFRIESACEALIEQLDHPNAIRKFHALRAANELGCISDMHRFESDPDREVAEYARTYHK